MDIKRILKYKIYNGTIFLNNNGTKITLMMNNKMIVIINMVIYYTSILL